MGANQSLPLTSEASAALNAAISTANSVLSQSSLTDSPPAGGPELKELARPANLCNVFPGVSSYSSATSSLSTGLRTTYCSAAGGLAAPPEAGVGACGGPCADGASPSMSCPGPTPGQLQQQQQLLQQQLQQLQQLQHQQMLLQQQLAQQQQQHQGAAPQHLREPVNQALPQHSSVDYARVAQMKAALGTEDSTDRLREQMVMMALGTSDVPAELRPPQEAQAMSSYDRGQPSLFSSSSPAAYMPHYGGGSGGAGSAGGGAGGGAAAPSWVTSSFSRRNDAAHSGGVASSAEQSHGHGGLST